MPAARLPSTALRALAPARLLLESSPAAVPALAAVAVLLIFAASDGGFHVTTWYPGGLFLAGLLLVSLIAARTDVAVPRGVLAATLLIAGYAAWSYLSILWADQQGPAWEGANRAALYAVIFALFALWPIRATPAAIVLGAFGLGIALLGLVELLRANDSADPAAFFVDGRFTEPVGYPNGNVALWMLGFWPCVALGARREIHPALRGGMLGGAVVLAGLVLMAQSRGSVFALPLVALVFLAVVPGRVRTLAALVGVAAGTLILSGAALDAYDALESGRDVVGAMGDATRAIVFTAAGVGILGTLAAYGDQRLAIPPEHARRGAAAVLAVAVVAAGAAFGVWVAKEGSPVTTISDAWTDFKGAPEPGDGGSRFVTLGTNRYDFWRVAWENFERNPLLGVGAENFQQDYLERRRSREEPRHPHSLELRVLSQTGLVGAALLAGGLALALVAGVGGAFRRRSDLGAVVAATGVTVFAYWFIHGSIDWFWEFAALGGAAFAMLGLAAGLVPRQVKDDAARRRATPYAGGWLAAPAALLALALAASFAAPWLAERHVERAAQAWSTDPDDAFDRLDRAARLNPLSGRPHLTAAAIAVRLRRFDEAERRLRAVLERDPRNAFATLELGAIASERRRDAEALSLMERAARLNPRDPVPVESLQAVRRGEHLDVARINLTLQKRAQARAR